MTRPTPRDRPRPEDTDGPLLTAYGLNKAFGLTQALSTASLSLGRGEIVALMGPSGSGKSTFLHCLAGVVRPDAGRIDYGGVDLTHAPDPRLSALRRTEFGFLFQFGQLVPELPCVENVALPLRLNGQRRRPAEREATRMLERLDVGDVARKRPGACSGGQGQRVAVARALITRPRVVFADEPTGALDSLNGEKVLRLLTDTARESGASVVLVTHEPRVAAYADREVIVRDGRTLDIGGGR
ncbi:ABC transporter ATP-binding protein [Nocardiopsis xinjiangensis]|uniref:ABC transporter ATP-binding protein n=1 Tax=Nocardiopsis xinjiangensis TaxID=124285 RepID=UPI000347E90E|nr:ABC transporter ATP-binding protein [Nocardiopsis xinjiangensis]